MSIPTEQQALILLTQLRQELKPLTLWQSSRPNLGEMASTLPFHYDTLTFEQWLQFVFIECISLMIDKNQPLSSEISLLPMAESLLKTMAIKRISFLKLLVNLIVYFQVETFND